MGDCDPVGVPELADRLGVAATTPHQWKGRGLMPPHDYVVSGVPAWDWFKVLEWAGDTGRIYRDTTVDEYRRLFGREPKKPRLGGPTASTPAPPPPPKRNARIGKARR